MVAREIKYLKTLEALKGEILSGKYSRRRIFPSVTAVTRRFGISRLTAVKVFDKLKELGLVHAHPGSGTFVSRNALARTIGLVMPGVACAATALTVNGPATASTSAPRMTSRLRISSAPITSGRGSA